MFPLFVQLFHSEVVFASRMILLLILNFTKMEKLFLRFPLRDTTPAFSPEARVGVGHRAGVSVLQTVHTAACRMASNPPSGASRFPDILSFWSSEVKTFRLLVSLMTFSKEKGGSLLGHGCLSLR